QLRFEALEARRWNMLHPDQPPRRSYLEATLQGIEGPFVAASDSMRTLPEQIAPWVPGGLLALGTDGFGRSETRASLRRFFEVDAAAIALAALSALAGRGKIDRALVGRAVQELGINPDQPAPWTV